MRSELTFFIAFLSETRLRHDIEKLGWTILPSAEITSDDAVGAKRRFCLELERLNSVHDFIFGYRKICVDSKFSIDGQLGILNLSRLYGLKVDKYLAKKFGYNHLIVGKSLVSTDHIYVSTSRHILNLPRNILATSKIRSMARVIKISGEAKDSQEPTNHFYITEKKNREVTILRPNLIIHSKNRNLLINCEPSLPAFSSRDGIQKSRMMISKPKVILPHYNHYELKSAHYPYSRKEDIFFHALHWTLPRFMFAIEKMRREKDSVLILNRNLEPRIREACLGYFTSQFGSDRIKLLDYSTSLSVKNLSVYATEYHNTSGRFFYEDKEVMKSFISEICSHDKRSPFLLSSRKVLLVRKENARNSNSRTIANWMEVQDLLTNSGFSIVDLGSLSLYQQFQVYSEAEVLVGMHGGHFSHLFNVGTKAQVVEIFAGLQSSCFKDMAKQYGVRYESVYAQQKRGEWRLDRNSLLKKIDLGV